MATELQYQRLRKDVGANEASLPDDDAEAIFVEAAETYTADGRSWLAHARVLAIRGLLASSAKLTTYRQNQSSENASDVFKHLRQLLAYWEDETDAAVADETVSTSGAAKFGAMRRTRGRLKEYPGG